MIESNSHRIVATVRRIIALLVERKYEELEELTGGVCLKAEYTSDGVNEYGRTLAMPPEAAFESLDVVQVTRAFPDQYSVRFDLYTEEEGRSDLSIEMTLIDEITRWEFLRAEIDNVHVF